MISKNWVTNKVVTYTPAGLRVALKTTPKVITTRLLELVLNRFFEPELKQNQLDFMAEKILRVDIQDLDFSFTVRLHNRKLYASLTDDSHQVSFRGYFIDLFLLSAQRLDPDTLFFRRRLMVTGDTEFGLQLKNLLDTIELKSRLPQHLSQLADEFADEAEQQQLATQ